uniref:phage tail tube protein n=1 Tax=Faecalicatena contorta TaxID=39482 RepID=UPI0029274176|nr:major tail protein [uncultured phage]
MLANGAKLGYKETTGASTYTDLPGLKEIPDMGVEPEKVDNTCLTDKNKQYENGIGDLGDMVYKFRYDNTSASSPYRILRGLQDSGKTYSFQETLPDGTTTTFEAQVSVKRTGGGVNGVIDCDATMMVQSDLVVTDPA